MIEAVFRYPSPPGALTLKRPPQRNSPFPPQFPPFLSKKDDLVPPPSGGALHLYLVTRSQDDEEPYSWCYRLYTYKKRNRSHGFSSPVRLTTFDTLRSSLPPLVEVSNFRFPSSFPKKYPPRRPSLSARELSSASLPDGF